MTRTTTLITAAIVAATLVVAALLERGLESVSAGLTAEAGRSAETARPPSSAPPGPAALLTAPEPTAAKRRDELASLQSLIRLVIAGLMLLLAGLAVTAFRRTRPANPDEAAWRILQDAVDSLPGGFALFDRDERLMICNHLYAKLFPGAASIIAPGVTFEAILRRDLAEGAAAPVGTEFEQAVAERLALFRRPGEPQEIVVPEGQCYRIAEQRTGNGGTVAIASEVTALRQHDTELRVITNELQQKNFLIDAALACMVQGIAMFDGDQRLVICNRRFLDLYHLPPELGVPGTELAAIAAASARAQGCSERATKVLVERRVKATQSRAPLDDEEILTDGRVINIVHRPLPGGGALAAHEDVSERYHTERALRNAKEEAELASRAKSEFLANVSHELRTPLNAIIGFSEIIRDQLFGAIGNDQYAEYASDIHHSGTHLLSVINDILDLSKVEAGKYELQEEEIRLRETVESTMRLMRERADAAGVGLVSHLPEPLPRLRADMRVFKQILLNLLSNAVKFTPHGGEVTVAVELDDGGRLTLTVCDTGIGMSPEDQRTALQPFGQADTSLSRKYNGTGLGLPLARRFAEMHDGRLILESTIGSGTSVTVIFPQERVFDDPGDKSRAAS